MRLAEGILIIAATYVAIGAIFAAVFVTAGLSKVDRTATGKGAPWSFRLIIFPGIVALWPLLLRKWMRATTRPPDIKT